MTCRIFDSLYSFITDSCYFWWKRNWCAVIFGDWIWKTKTRILKIMISLSWFWTFVVIASLKKIKLFIVWNLIFLYYTITWLICEVLTFCPVCCFLARLLWVHYFIKVLCTCALALENNELLEQLTSCWFSLMRSDILVEINCFRLWEGNISNSSRVLTLQLLQMLNLQILIIWLHSSSN